MVALGGLIRGTLGELERVGSTLGKLGRVSVGTLGVMRVGSTLGELMPT